MRAREGGLAGAEVAGQRQHVAGLERGGDVHHQPHGGLLVRQHHREARAACGGQHGRNLVIGGASVAVRCGGEKPLAWQGEEFQRVINGLRPPAVPWSRAASDLWRMRTRSVAGRTADRAGGDGHGLRPSRPRIDDCLLRAPGRTAVDPAAALARTVDLPRTHLRARSRSGRITGAVTRGPTWMLPIETLRAARATGFGAVDGGEVSRGPLICRGGRCCGATRPGRITGAVTRGPTWMLLIETLLPPPPRGPQGFGAIDGGEADRRDGHDGRDSKQGLHDECSQLWGTTIAPPWPIVGQRVAGGCDRRHGLDDSAAGRRLRRLPPPEHRRNSAAIASLLAVPESCHNGRCHDGKPAGRGNAMRLAAPKILAPGRKRHCDAGGLAHGVGAELSVAADPDECRVSARRRRRHRRARRRSVAVGAGSASRW